MGEVIAIKPELEYPKWLDQDRWNDWRQIRRETHPKAPDTLLSEKASLRKLEAMIKQGHSQSTILDNAIEHAWIGLWEPK